MTDPQLPLTTVTTEAAPITTKIPVTTALEEPSIPEFAYITCWGDMLYRELQKLGIL